MVALNMFGLCMPATAATQTSGFIKTLANISSYADDSIFYLQDGSSTTSTQSEFRLNLAVKPEPGESESGKQNLPTRWDFNMDTQVLVIDAADTLINSAFSTNSLNDESRLLDLSMELNESNPYSVLRLDRFNVGYTGEKLVLRAGRQALSWGSGLLFSVMDIVNPFDGRVYDQEYKIGDDMLYLQYLLANGSDVQAAAVLRRNSLNSELENAQHTFAGKYHAFLQSLEIDFLLAQHYGEELAALGINSALGGAVVYAELAYSRNSNIDGENDKLVSALAGASYSWMWFARNVSGVLEYYHNGAGLSGNFTYEDVLANTTLLEHIQHGDTALLAKNYLAASSTIELTPLLISSANIFFSLEDQSALLQLSTQYDWQQNLQVFFALAVPVGNEGGEFSGLASEMPGFYFSSEWQAQARLAWYF